MAEARNSLGIDTFIISFIVCCNSPSCRKNEASFAGRIGLDPDPQDENSKETLKAIETVIHDFEKKGGKIVISFGGADNEELALCHSDPNALAKQYKRVIQKFHPSRIDFDIEGSHESSNTHKLRAEALSILRKELQEDMPLISLCLPVNPDIGFDSSTLSIIETMKENEINIDLISIMAMDYGSYYSGTDSYLNALHSLEKSYKQSKSYYPNIKMGVIPMIGENDDGSVFSLSDASNLIQNLKTRDYVGMVSMWSINRDKNKGNFVSLSSNTYQNPDYKEKCGGNTQYAYSKILINFLN